MEWWQQLRDEFVVTENLVYLNHAAVSPLPRRCRQYMEEYLDELARHGALHYPDFVWQMLAETRQLGARLLGARPEQVFFMRSTTQGLGIAATGLPCGEGDNIVLVEVGGKTGVVPFDDVWPRASRSETDFAEPEQTRRVFYGDMAICSKMLNMVSKPFAEVVITFFEETVPPFMRRFRPSVSGPIPSDRIQTLRERLEKANLKVTDWNLAQDIARQVDEGVSSAVP